MPTSGHSNYRPDSLQRAAWEKHIAQLGDVPLHDLCGMFAVTDMVELDTYQQQASIDVLTADPISPDFRDTYQERASVLANNTSTYSDEAEDEMVGDETMQRIMMQRRKDPTSPELTAALRARRSVIAYLLEVASDENGGHTSLPDSA